MYQQQVRRAIIGPGTTPTAGAWFLVGLIVPPDFNFRYAAGLKRRVLPQDFFAGQIPFPALVGLQQQVWTTLQVKVSPYQAVYFKYRQRPQMLTLSISGVTRDSNGVPVPSATVKLYRTTDDVKVDTTVSDSGGNYLFIVNAMSALQYYAVAYKVTAPDIAGTTVNTLVGT